METNRKLYIDKCRAEFEEIRKDNKLLIHYILDRKRRRVGVLVAAKPDGGEVPLMGWSLCNMKRDNFNKYIGLCKALDRLQHGNPVIDDEDFFIPNTVACELPHFSERVERYFKTLPVAPEDVKS